MGALKIVVTDDRYNGNYTVENRILREIKASVEIKKIRSEAEAIEFLRDADAVLVNLFSLSARIIRSMENCKVISRYGVGFDNVDVDTATKMGIWVARVPDYCVEDVSDHAVALLLACVRNLVFHDHMIRRGEWNLSSRRFIYRIRGKTLGLVGYGAIARAVHKKLAGFSPAHVLAYDPYLDHDVIEKNRAIPVSLKTLLRKSDFVSVHAPLNDETRHMIGRHELALMKKSALLINTSRGPVIDETALAQVLAKKEIAGAGLDVFETEPLPEKSPLRTLDNVILSDHTGWYSEESLVELKTKVAKNIVDVLKGGKPAYPVNNPVGVAHTRD